MHSNKHVASLGPSSVPSERSGRGSSVLFSALNLSYSQERKQSGLDPSLGCRFPTSVRDFFVTG